MVRNAIRCNICGDEIEPKYRHDYVACKCGACAVDGGHDYLRRVYSKEVCFAELSVVAKEDDGRTLGNDRMNWN